MKLTKYHYHVLTIKDRCQVMKFILWLQKGCDKKEEIEKDFDRKEEIKKDDHK